MCRIFALVLVGWVSAVLSLPAVAAAPSSPEPVPPVEPGAEPVVECSGVAWPTDYIPATETIAAPSQRLGLRGTVTFPELRLGPIDVLALMQEDEANRGQPKAPRMGISRPINEPVAGQWTNAPDGARLWTAALAADGALALRLHFADVQLPPGAELYIYSPTDAAAMLGPYTEGGPFQRGEFWTGMLKGDVAYVEAYFPNADTTAVPLRIDQLAHMYRDPDDPDGLRGVLDCMGDPSCYPAWLDLSHAVARILMFSDGGWAYCSGTLLAAQNNDLTPYFLTSAHCLDVQSEADTIEFLWFYQTTSCGGPVGGTSSSLYADLLATSGATVGSDWTLLRVKGVLPAGVYWSGWTTATPPSDSWTGALHHPDASWKRYSRGKRYTYDYYYDKIVFNVSGAIGTIYFGSSGSGIWTESDQKLFGNSSWVSSANAGCDYLSTFGGYGRFMRYYATISSFLAAGSDDALEQNDTCAAAYTTGSGTYSNLVVKSLDEDWYKIGLGHNETLTVTLTFTDANGNINAQLYDVCGGSVVAAAAGIVDNETLAYTNPGPTANFYLRVYLADDTRNEYGMTITGAFADCDGNGIADPCDLDCGQPGGPCYGIPGCGQAEDCNYNSTPDICEPQTDCQPNGTQDICDIAAGTSRDCQADGTPDECQLTGNDCNANTTPDECDIAAATSDDCQPDGTPDECQLAGNDCNANTTPDECETDCNANGHPDDCDIASGTSGDCDANGVPDECQEDCNTNGVADPCDLLAGTSHDCNTNGRPDECEGQHCHYLWNGFQGLAYQLPMNGLDIDGDGVAWSNPADTAKIWLYGCEGGSASDRAVQVLVGTDPPENGYVVSEYFRSDAGTLYPDDAVYALSFKPRFEGYLNPKTDWQFTLYDAVRTAAVVQIHFASTVSQYPGIVIPNDRGYILVKNPSASPVFINTGVAVSLAHCYDFKVVLDNTAGTVQLYIDGVARLNPALPVLVSDARRTDYFRVQAVANGAGSGGTTAFKLDAFHLCALGSILPPTAWDCNGNRTLDACDVASGVSYDCNANGVPEECEKGDFNGDQTVNLTDYQTFQSCFTGPGGSLGGGCGAGDFDCDNDIDLRDFAWFQLALPVR